jgi:hypothetical protein
VRARSDESRGFSNLIRRKFLLNFQSVIFEYESERTKLAQKLAYGYSINPRINNSAFKCDDVEFSQCGCGARAQIFCQSTSGRPHVLRIIGVPRPPGKTRASACSDSSTEIQSALTLPRR